MKVLVSNQTGIEVGYLACRYPGRLGHLYSPGGERGPYRFLDYALDNGAFVAFKNGSAWSEAAWRRLLVWAALSGQRPLWALVPDVVGDRAGTLARWAKYVGEVRRLGFRPALALQDDMTFADVPDDDSMLFLGGSTAWKEEAIEPWCRTFPGRVHVGRVNTFGRLIRCHRAGAVSVDGTGWFHRQGGQHHDLIRFLKATDGDRPCQDGAVLGDHRRSWACCSAPRRGATRISDSRQRTLAEALNAAPATLFERRGR